MSDPTPRLDGNGPGDSSRHPSTVDDADHLPTVDDADHVLTVEFGYADELRARTIAGSVAVEAGEAPDDRSRAYVARDGRIIVVNVAATDLTALRAGANTWFRLVGVAEAVADAAGDRRERRRDGDGDG